MSKAKPLLEDQLDSPPGPQEKHSSSLSGRTECSSAEPTLQSGPACSPLQQGSVETSNKQGKAFQRVSNNHETTGVSSTMASTITLRRWQTGTPSLNTWLWRLPTGESVCSTSCNKLPALPRPLQEKASNAQPPNLDPNLSGVKQGSGGKLCGRSLQR